MSAPTAWQPRPGSPLTAREIEVLGLLARGYSAGQTAHELGIVLDSVKVHTRNVRRRLGAKCTLHAVTLAIAAGQLPADIAVTEVAS